MAHQAEPMDIDSDFDNKENSLHHNNVLPFTEKGYEELDVSELNMKLRYSITPASSPMSKSYTANCDNRSLESGDETLNVTINENSNLTRSLNSNMSKNDNVVKSLKALPLQAISTEQFGDSNRSTSVLRPHDTTVTRDNANVTVTVSGPSDIDENSLLSSSSSAVPTPEATTPTKDNLKNEGGGSSPIMRGIKTVLNMFRSSQSPIPPADNEDIVKPNILSPVEATLSTEEAKSQAMLFSTPISAHRKKETSPTKRNSPHKESVVFNEDLEKELQWKDETTIIFSQERIPLHKLFFQHPQTEIINTNQNLELPTQEIQDDMNSTVEYMDISYNDSFRDRTMTGCKTDCTFTGESDAEFVDCETTFTKNDSLLEDKDKTPVNETTQDLDLTKYIESTNENTSASRLKQIILNTTQDILDATLSITPEDLLPEALLKTQNKPGQYNNILDQVPQSENTVVIASEKALEKVNEIINTKVFDETLENSITSQENFSALNQTVDVMSLSVDKGEKSNVTTTFENVIQPILDQTVEITNSIEKVNETINTNVFDKTLDNSITSQVNLSALNQTVDVMSLSVDKGEESNVTTTFENVIQPILDQTVEITNSIEKINETINTNVFDKTLDNSITSQVNLSALNQTVDVMSLSVDKGEESNVTTTFENVIQPILDQTVEITNSIEKVNETIHAKVFDQTLENFITSEENLPALNETVDAISLSVDKSEESNVTRTFENVIQPISDQTVEIANSVMNTEYKEEPNVIKIMENISSEAIPFDSQHNVLGYPVSPSSSETLVLNEKNIEGLRRQSTSHNDHNLNQDITQDIEPNNTSLDTTNVSEHNSTNLAEATNTTIYNPETLEEIVNKSLYNPDGEGKSSPIKEATMTELAAEVPLPDEDDLEKELNIADQTDASSLPLDLVDNIKDQTEITEIIHKMTLEKAKQIIKVEGNNEDKTVLPQALPLNTSNFERGDNIQNESLTSDQEITKEVPEVITDVNVRNEKPPLTEEPQVITADVLPESAPSLNIDTETENKIDQVQYDVEVLNQTEIVTKCLKATVTHNPEENIRLSQHMDINGSVIGLNPLPDIVNQTNIVLNVDNVELAQNIPEPVLIEQQANLLENLKMVANEVISPEIVPRAAHNVVPELLSDVSDVSNTQTNANELFPANDEISKDSVTDSTATIATEDIPVATGSVTDTQLNYVNVIPTEPDIPDNENQHIHTNVPVSKTADIKTEDDEIILSEKNSPFVSVIAEDIPGMKPEDNTDVQNIDHRLATAGKVVFTPPASPPIASKGYNFNFDEMDDPFATKTKIRVSPSLDTPTKAVESKMSSRSVEKPMPKKEIMNRRKSQPERKKPVAPKRKFNSTYSGAVSDKTAESPIEKSAVVDINLAPPPTVALELSNVTIEDKLIEEAKIIHEMTLDVAKEARKLEQELVPKDEIVQPVITSSAEVIETDESATLLSKNSKSTLSSEQSAYYSARTSSNESFHSRNVFNIPEIDDKNFNPFATKSKMRLSPPLKLDMKNSFAAKGKISSPDSSMILPQNDEVNALDITKTTLHDNKMETELMEKDGSGNLSNTTTSSKATDEESGTVKEVNTEDEDTIEGPFLEAEDLNTDDKMSDFDGENIDMMQFHDLPTQGNDENGELFIDAEAFEFLLNQNKSNTVVDSGKESLFLKFDPLFAKRMSSITSESLVASLNKIQKRQSTPTKPTMPDKEVKSPISGPSNLNRTQDMDITHDMDVTHNSSEEFNEDLNVTVSKPMMVVPPAVNPVTPRNKSLTPNRSNRRSLTFTSPAMAVIDRLLSLSGNSSVLHDTTVTHATREQNEADLALTQLRELLAEKEINVYSLRSESKELKDRLTSLESHLKSLEEESQDRLKKINHLNDRLAEKTKINKSMAAVVEEYERTIASLISETAQDKKRHAEERIKLINERDEQTAHLASMEVSFSDLHSKYEKSKQVILNCKANEDAYKKSIKEFEENLTKMQNNYELLKQHATSKLNHANQELEKMNRTHEAEVLKLNAMIKRKDLHITSLEESLAQKTKANEELTAICDELINKVG